MILEFASRTTAQPSLVPPLGTVTDVQELMNELPTENELEQNVPNPSTESTIIGFSLMESGHATLKVYDASGKVVAVLVDEHLSAGNRNSQLQTWNLPSGIYFYQLSLNNKVIGTNRLMILDQ
jgi:hypothetical protein